MEAATIRVSGLLSSLCWQSITSSSRQVLLFIGLTALLSVLTSAVTQYHEQASRQSRGSGFFLLICLSLSCVCCAGEGGRQKQAGAGTDERK